MDAPRVRQGYLRGVLGGSSGGVLRGYSGGVLGATWGRAQGLCLEYPQGPPPRSTPLELPPDHPYTARTAGPIARYRLGKNSVCEDTSIY